MRRKKTIIGLLVTAVVGAALVTVGIKSFAAGTEEAPVYITCSNGSVVTDGEGVAINGQTITITEAGYYSISGELTNGQIIVEADDDADEVEVELNGLSASCNDGPVFYVKSAAQTNLSAKKGTTNTLTDSSSYTLEDGEDEPNACVYAKDDLKVQGKGVLNVNGNYMHGINCKDDLNVKNLTLNVNAKEDGIRGKDSLEIKSGIINVNAGDDAIIAFNDEDAEEGYLEISDGTIAVDCGDDAVKAEYYITISDTAVIDINSCYEGIEAPTINLAGGDVDIVSSDDGINASDGSGSSNQGMGQQPGTMSSGTGMINITGGTYYVNSTGDGIDANGSIAMSGGTVYVDGPTASDNSALDYDGQFAITGGTFVGVGSSGMAQAPTANVSTQYSVSASYSGNVSGNFILKDSSSNELINYTPAKAYQNIVISCPDIVANGSYTLTAGGSSSSFTASSIVTTIGGQGGQSGPGGGGNFGPTRTMPPLITIAPTATATTTAVATQTPSTSDYVTIYYKTSWTTTYIHYKVGDGSWTSVPGVAMSSSGISGYSTITINLNGSSSITCCFNDGNGTWDNNNSGDYKLAAGTYTIANTTVINGTPAVTTQTPTVSPTTTVATTEIPNTTVNPTATTTSVATETPSSNVVYIYYYTGWTNAYIHYQIGSGSWTTVPGEEMSSSVYSGYKYAAIDLGSSTTLKCCFNNGSGTWDNNSGNDYSLTAGTYKIVNGNISTGVPAVTVSADNTITVYYYTSWSNAYIHYQIGSDSWTSVPGVAMSSSDVSGYKVITINLGSASSLTACFNNGNGTWDNNSSKNYSFSSAGIYTVKNGAIVNAAP